MRENSLVAIQPKRYKQTTKANPDHPVAPNLLNRDFQADLILEPKERNIGKRFSKERN
jgi:hypothetical protein